MENGDASYRRFLDGDDHGLTEIIRDYKDGLILYLNGITGNILLSEELMEDTFARIAIKKPAFRGKSSFKTWLYAIGRNVAIDHLRKESRHKCVSMEECADISDDEESLEESYIREERRIYVHRVLRRLKKDYRQVLYLTYFEGFTNAETAQIMKKSRRQIENLVYRARQSLKSELDKEGYVYEGL